VLGLRAGFFRDDPHTGDPLPVRDAQGTAIGPATLIPAGTRPGHHSPIHDAFGLYLAEETAASAGL
jgi:hypothetical protein